ncbi:hypothetical protein NDU88_001195 [Pleurodeles waltl]|uniref:Uncharacterized protein n=1 Tax=Pleurodeles waltl TaxID=8319 RepID=A0AAV7R8B9_PLEWA|nr:hypothetical protein NDU88_001195 [Pleurodeles waltl]
MGSRRAFVGPRGRGGPGRSLGGRLEQPRFWRRSAWSRAALPGWASGGSWDQGYPGGDGEPEPPPGAESAAVGASVVGTAVAVKEAGPHRSEDCRCCCWADGGRLTGLDTGNKEPEAPEAYGDTVVALLEAVVARGHKPGGAP